MTLPRNTSRKWRLHHPPCVDGFPVAPRSGSGRFQDAQEPLCPYPLRRAALSRILELLLGNEPLLFVVLFYGHCGKPIPNPWARCSMRHFRPLRSRYERRFLCDQDAVPHGSGQRIDMAPKGATTQVTGASRRNCAGLVPSLQIIVLPILCPILPNNPC
jgi:hypothetical protein